MVHWVGLESNPAVFSDYIHKLGVSPEWVTIASSFGSF